MHNLVLGFLNIGSSEMILIVFVALLLFGGEKLPEIARGLGKGIRDFKDASDGVKREINNQINSYEEKREEDKRVEEATKTQEAGTQNQLPAHPEGYTPVENTVSVGDNPFMPADNSTEHAADSHSPADHAVAEAHDTEHAATITEHHAEASNHEATASGHTKNT
ncbi:MAG: twin-arginine translocase TatA/TatE family subunit [Mucilaginibacter sp.]